VVNGVTLFMRRLRWRRWLEYAVFRGAVALMRILPVWTQRCIAWSLAFALCRLLPRRLSRYDLAFRNLKESFGDQYSDTELDRIIFRMWQHLVRLVCEVVQFPGRVTCENCCDVIDFRNKQSVIQALCSDRPVIMLSGHLGNWEVSIATFGLFGFPMGIVARSLDNEWLDDWFRRFRESTGHVLIDKDGGGADMQDRLGQGGHVGLLADQDAGKRGIFVDFFGRPASTYRSIALLALQYDALICVGYAQRLPDASHRNGWVRYELGCEAVIDPRELTSADPVHELTQAYTTALEQIIRRAPEQYFWVHRRWKTPVTAKFVRRRKRAA